MEQPSVTPWCWLDCCRCQPWVAVGRRVTLLGSGPWVLLSADLAVAAREQRAPLRGPGRTPALAAANPTKHVRGLCPKPPLQPQEKAVAHNSPLPTQTQPRAGRTWSMLMHTSCRGSDLYSPACLPSSYLPSGPSVVVRLNAGAAGCWRGCGTTWWPTYPSSKSCSSSSWWSSSSAAKQNPALDRPCVGRDTCDKLAVADMQLPFGATM
jgi:hypothetical protein